MSDDLRDRYGLVEYTQAEYRDALAGLLPTGAAWAKASDSTLMLLLMALGAEFERLNGRASQLLAETIPSSTTELLPDWERNFGLPEECVVAAQTVLERRMAFEAKLTSMGGQSRDFFIGLAATLGYGVVTIDEFTSLAAATAAGITFTGDDWAHTWRVNLSTGVHIVPFRVGAGSVGEPLRSFGNEVIDCQFNDLKPAHTRLIFGYPP